MFAFLPASKVYMYLYGRLYVLKCIACACVLVVRPKAKVKEECGYFLLLPVPRRIELLGQIMTIKSAATQLAQTITVHRSQMINDMYSR